MAEGLPFRKLLSEANIVSFCEDSFISETGYNKISYSLAGEGEKCGE
jgi:hypothetical protein